MLNIYININFFMSLMIFSNCMKDSDWYKYKKNMVKMVVNAISFIAINALMTSVL